MKFLLVAPRYETDNEQVSPLNAFDASIGGYEMNPSTAIATIAAMAPAGIDVELCNEVTQPLDFDSDADFIGVTANVGQAKRALWIADEFRSRGKPVVMGGPHVTLAPEVFRDHCDCMFTGELEAVADRFFADMATGTLKPHYNGPGIDLTASPAPRWDLYPTDRLATGIVQTSRGCPFTCNFCDVIQYLGNRQRYKSVGQVMDEIRQLYDLGFASIMITDDNFSANRKKSTEILAAIEEWNGAEGRDFVTFQTQLSVNMTKHESMLSACYRAGLLTAYMGIESDDPAALDECDKRPNKGFDLIRQCETSIKAGVRVEAAFIVGFDSDNLSAFERQFRFAMALPIGTPRISPLVAPISTPLFDDMRAAGRLINDDSFGPCHFTSNFQPAQMSRAELYIGLRWLISSLYHPDNFFFRVERLADMLAPPPWIARGLKQKRAPRPAVARMTSALLKEAMMMDWDVRALIDRTLELARTRPENGWAISEILFRYLAILSNLTKTGMFDMTWGEMAAPPFERGYSDHRLESIRREEALAA
ncbi:radical SAM superfamily enzyme YgiQ (UPF0313 family) [Breoghania corrubedonensis]|uniref:Radical SAM superfamily enzyme YgiQ (UPF0313 family) n=1 Tax=Breoghania corrubedonensis TaxID=665038 RepID=A0A2T5VFT6_9HYPH|nr:radical SAM protein [Breoghania corrubedonensis]PTW62586.1 radical SAM superfamily enzyme YgiQ (UPF0313 family) [Breoghania corrubedonensis]